MGIEKGGKFAVGVDHKQVEAWFRKAKPPQEMRVDIGLYLRRGETTAHWYYRYKSPINGKQTRAPLWTAADPSGALGFPSASIAEARSRAAILRGQVTAGIDPVLRAVTEAQQREEAERKAAKEREARITVRQLFDRWCSTELKASVTPSGERSGRKDNGAYLRGQFERHVFPLIGDLIAPELRKADLLKVVDFQKAEGKLRTADVLFSSLQQMLNFALDRELIESNPLATVRKKHVVGKQTERSRFLSEEEIQLLGTALTTARFNERGQAALWLILATGVRVGECMGAVWSEAIRHTQQAVSSLFIKALQISSLLGLASRLQQTGPDSNDKCYWLPRFMRNKLEFRIGNTPMVPSKPVHTICHSSSPEHSVRGHSVTPFMQKTDKPLNLFVGFPCNAGCTYRRHFTFRPTNRPHADSDTFWPKPFIDQLIDVRA